MGSGGLRATFRSAERESQCGNPTLEHEHPPAIAYEPLLGKVFIS
ncbi:hypothetical protein [Mangrovibacterium diazotrophicum]|uniref:Uncharacterized protein n=1 Tax=Mangrovibacterium diazotrophicum TaxID=1261403 RepID=A0A419VVG1_9BACT|nr:hypothetical protein [Mangrovibacterium diazotrophicum]RKD86002.1 hypothetical protein BC643_4318 [Mangrovibacterium diazotrophicum]